MAENRLQGVCASPGIASGTLFVAPSHEVERNEHGTPAAEEGVLRAALVQAAGQLASMMESCDQHSAEIIEFQLAFVEDDELSAPAFAAIEGGESAHQAWNQAVKAEAAKYRADDNEHFRARASDLDDLRVRVLACMVGYALDMPFPKNAIVLAHDLALSSFLSIDWRDGGAVVLTGGSTSSHLAMLARSRGVPMLVDVNLQGQDANGLEALVDAEAGEVVLAPSEETRILFEARKRKLQESAVSAQEALFKPAVARSGERIAVHINVAAADELDTLDPGICDGIGLVRTEFLFHQESEFPGEERQFQVYRKIVTWAQGRPVVIRTLDAGADKPIRGLTLGSDSNQFLGMRGVRLSLARPEIFRVQLRALARAAVYGQLKILVPMVTVPEEIDAVRALLEAEVASLQATGAEATLPPLGIMIEVPAAAIAIDLYKADFYSVGSNDLTQYVTAAGRDSPALAKLANPLNAGVLRLIAHVAKYGADEGISVSLCGDAAADKKVLPHLLATGLRSVSVGIAAVGRVKAAIAELDIAAGQRELGSKESLRA